MEVKTKKRLTNAATGIFFLLGGIEYAVIIPTLFSYIESLDGNESFYGLTYASFSISGLFAGLVFGHVTDRMRKTKLCIVAANTFEIGGNIMYFIGKSKYMLLGGRLVSGIGTGAGASIFAQLAWTSTEKERTAVFSIALALRQFGLFIGPGLNIFLEKIHFQVGPFPVNKFSAPGIFMATMWCILQVIMIFMYFDLPSIHEVGSAYDHMTKQNQEQYKSESDDYTTTSTQSGKTVEKEILSVRRSVASIQAVSTNDENSCTSGDTTYHIPSVETHVIRRGWSRYVDEYIREEIVLLLGFQFILFFNQCTLESLVVPLTTRILGWSSIDNSFFFCGASVLAITIFFAVKSLSKRLADRWIIVIGLLFETTATCYLTVFMPVMKPLVDITKNTVIVVVGCALTIIGLPCFMVGSVSLLSKLTSMKMQGTTQGIRRVVTSLGTIMGPMWASSFLKRMYVMFGVMLSLQALLIVLTISSFQKLKVKSADRGTESDEEAAKPLLADNN